jgi:hypothetical protein
MRLRESIPYYNAGQPVGRDEPAVAGHVREPAGPHYRLVTVLRVTAPRMKGLSGIRRCGILGGSNQKMTANKSPPYKP